MILIAGATGLVGRAVAEVVSQGRRPWTELSRRAREDAVGEESRTLVACDVTDPSALARALRDVRSIVHVAGVAPGQRPARADHEIAAMRSLVALARERKVDRFVFLSAIGAAPDASHAWLRAKSEAEQLLRESGVAFVVLRAGLVTAPEAPVMHAIAQVVRGGVRTRRPLLRAGRVLPIASGDVAIALASALDHHRMAGQTIDIGTPPALTLDELLSLVAQRLRRTLQFRRLPWAGPSLASALACVEETPLTDAESLLRLFALLEAPDVAAYDRLLPMRRTSLSEELRTYPWGAAAPRVGEPLPTLRESAPSGMPLFIPGNKLRETGEGAMPPASWFGRVDPYGRPLGTDESRERTAHERDDAAGEER